MVMLNLKKTYDSAEYEKKVAEMMKVQSQWMFQLGKDLKDLGYKKVHYLGFSFGSFLTNYFIKEYGDLAFKNIDSITSVGTRIKFDEKDVKVNVKQNKFPFKFIMTKLENMMKLIFLMWNKMQQH